MNMGKYFLEADFRSVREHGNMLDRAGPGYIIERGEIVQYWSEFAQSRPPKAALGRATLKMSGVNHFSFQRQLRCNHELGGIPTRRDSPGGPVNRYIKISGLPFVRLVRRKPGPCFICHVTGPIYRRIEMIIRRKRSMQGENTKPSEGSPFIVHPLTDFPDPFPIVQGCLQCIPGCGSVPRRCG